MILSFAYKDDYHKNMISFSLPGKRFLILIIGLISLLILEFQYLNMYFHTPKDSVYLGTVHFPPDYFSYLSFIAQGKDHFLSSTILYTSEKIPYVLVRWQFVLMGRILSIFSLDAGQMYQIAVAIFTISFIVSGYLLISLLLEKYEEKLLAFIFFVSSTAWPVVEIKDRTIHLSFHSFWYNTGNVFSRFGPTPNHLLGSTLLTVGFVILLVWHKKFEAAQKINYFLYVGIFIIIGLALSSISPMHWLLLLGSVAGLLIFLAFRIYIIEKKNIKNKFRFILPAVTLLIGGLPGALYIQIVYLLYPYNITKFWEAPQQQPMNLIILFYGSGIVILFAIVGTYSYFREKLLAANRILTLCFVCVCIVFYFSNLPTKLGISNVRFWPEGIYVFISILAANGVFFLASISKKAKKFILGILLLVYLLTTIPTIISGIKERLVIDNINMYYYLPRQVFDVYDFASNKIKRPSVFLLPWPYNLSFPAFTGQKSFTGESLSLTINVNRKKDIEKQFFSGTLDDNRAKELLSQNGIQYILTPEKTTTEKYGFLKKIFSSGESAVYEVIK